MKPLLSRHLRDLLKCPFKTESVRSIEVVKIAFVKINIQQLLCTVIKLHVV